MRRIALLGFVLLLTLAPGARGQKASRPVRVGNVNVLVFGFGHPSFDHPNFEDQGYPSLMYQHRILRRELRQIPLWLRGAVTFMEQDRKIYGYTVWQPSDDVPFAELVTEHTSDFTVRFEALADLLHSRHLALYAGGGFGLHALTFNSDGALSAITPFKATENDASPSLALGVRLFAAERSATLYGEMRYGKAYGRKDPVGQLWLTDDTFGFTSVQCLSFEGGAGVHW
jgi:hypothetical protein